MNWRSCLPLSIFRQWKRFRPFASRCIQPPLHKYYDLLSKIADYEKIINSKTNYISSILALNHHPFIPKMSIVTISTEWQATWMSFRTSPFCSGLKNLNPYVPLKISCNIDVIGLLIKTTSLRYSHIDQNMVFPYQYPTLTINFLAWSTLTINSFCLTLNIT